MNNQTKLEVCAGDYPSSMSGHFGLDHRAVRKWVENGSKTARGLVKALPTFAQGLRDGSIENDAGHLASILFEISERESQTEQDKTSLETKRIADELTRRLLRKLETPQEIAAGSRFSGQLMEGVGRRAMDSSYLTGAYSAVVCEVYNELVQGSRPHIEAALSRPLPAESLSPLTLEEYTGLAQHVKQISPELHKTEAIRRNEVIEVIESVIFAVREGDDLLKRTCWECGKAFDDNLGLCQKCKVARYCSRECQVQSWSEGHKRACGELPVIYRWFKDNRNRVNKALRDGMVLGTRIKPNFHSDYNSVLFMGFCITKDNGPSSPINLPAAIREKLGLPSMHRFYINLSLIAREEDRREHWLFSDTPLRNVDLDDDTGKETNGQALLPLVTYMLAVDISGLDRMEFSVFRNWCASTLVDPATRQPMFAKHFLQLYADSEVVFGSKDMRRTVNAAFTKLMMNEFHKK